MENNRSTIFHIYTIFKKHSGPGTPLNTADIMSKMTLEWGVPKPPDRKTVYKHIEELQRLSENGLLDGELVPHPDKKKGHYFIPSISKGEIKLLCDAIASSRFIPKTQSKELIEKLASPHGDEFISKFSYMLELKNPKEKAYNSGFFDSIEEVSKAIESKTKISFQYLQYDLNKKLVPKYTEDGGYITVSPYYLIWTLDHYYLFCKLDKNGQERFLRMDKIVNVKQRPDERISPPELQAEYDVRDYSRNQAFMFGGKMERIKLRCQMRMLQQAVDFFGEAADIRPLDDGHFELQVVTSVESVKYWVLQYITAIDDIRPPELRSIIVGFLEDALARNK